ncbi:hypothetical protein HELRODRAFT_173976 [Helobdella robusta]|uniref:Uncharacterized protein n=1 Tax=Helobdella robusta TaxID=6412 RepID=T1F7F7_HELRO|nr:hypothetical protein HELRODRAFT_173976 [Helobdella robusta]ESO03093.1 hypothetical protein HELRODRAFT_173976 [Helobdella robusta]
MIYERHARYSYTTRDLLNILEAKYINNHDHPLPLLHINSRKTWLNDETAKLVRMNDYNFVFKNRSDRSDRIGGGVGIFIRSGIEFSMINNLLLNDTVIDLLGVNLKLNNTHLTAVLKCVPVYDHIPKPCREKFAYNLNALLTAVCNGPGDPAHWVRLHRFVPYVLQKTSRGGRRVNQGNLVNKRLSEYSTIGLETLGNLSSVVRLVCSPEGLAESSPATFDKLCSIHPKIAVHRRVFPALTPTAADVLVLKPWYCVHVHSTKDSSPVLCTFKNGSSGGLDGLRPQHLKDVFSGPLLIDDTLNSLTQFINLILSGACPLSVRRKECGLAAARAADENIKKYGNALPSMEFLPICIEVLGPMDPITLKFFKEICKMISVRSGDSREHQATCRNIREDQATCRNRCLLQRFLHVCVLENIQLNADLCN